MLDRFFRYDLNYGLTTEEFDKANKEEGGVRKVMRKATNVIYADASRPSHILVPIRKVSEDASLDQLDHLIPFSNARLWLERRPTWSR